jgi:hypothetical protein
MLAKKSYLNLVEVTKLFENKQEIEAIGHCNIIALTSYFAALNTIG